jgi:DnaJ-class molecular chaperone
MADEHAAGAAKSSDAASQATNPGDDAAPGTPGTGEDICPRCQGQGRIDNNECENCGGTGIVIKGLAGG